jgi:hypothetical protein
MFKSKEVKVAWLDNFFVRLAKVTERDLDSSKKSNGAKGWQSVCMRKDKIHGKKRLMIEAR